MRRFLAKGLIVTVATVAFASLAFCQTSKHGRLLTRQEVATTWIGLSEDELYLVRIVLLESGKGVVGYTFLDDAAIVRRVESWTYDPKASSRIGIKLIPGQEPVLDLGGDVIGVRMELTMSQGDWSRRVSLRRERDLEHRWRQLKDGMLEE